MNYSPIAPGGGGRFDKVQIGFCGQLYAIAELQGQYYYEWEPLDAAIREVYKNYNTWGYNIQQYRSAKSREWFNYTTPELMSWFEKYHTPVFIVTPGKHGRYSRVYMHTDSDVEFEHEHQEVDSLLTLQDVGFYRQVDTYQAFQSIHQYLSGVLGMGQPHIPEMSDKDMRDIKGFDEWSFKKLPTKRKKL